MIWWWHVETNPVHQQILATLRTRVVQVLRTDEDKIPAFSVGELLNILFLMNRQWGSVGDYIVTLRTLQSKRPARHRVDALGSGNE